MSCIYLVAGLLLLCGIIDMIEISDCESPLGMENFKIPDSAITVSSSFDNGITGPKSARIRQEILGGAWCPKSSGVSGEYLQIDFEEFTVVTKVEVQGRFGNGMGREYAEQFRLEYQREDCGEWFRFKNRQGSEIFNGNTNTYLSEFLEVDPPIACKRIRFIPLSQTRQVCMRVELYGCKW